MKKVNLILSIVFFSVTLFAQDNDNEMKTIFNAPDSLSFGAFGGVNVNFSGVGDEFGVLAGGSGGVIINHKFVFGGVGYGLTTEMPIASENYDALDLDISNGEDYEFHFGYGGVLAGFVIGWKRPIHLYTTVLIGAGGIGISDTDRHRHDDFDDVDDNHGNFVLVVQPNLELEFNLTKFMILGIGANYRYVSGVDFEGYDNMDFSGVGANVSLKFGLF